MERNFKRKIFVFSLGVLFLSLKIIATDSITALRIEREIEKYKSEIISIRRYLHMNPELSNREFETAKLVSSKLISLGLEVKTGVAKTGVNGLLHGSQQGITVALRAALTTNLS